MVKKTMYDPWQSITTRNGYAGDEVISALQKSIRRANEEDACKFAYELYISGAIFTLTIKLDICETIIISQLTQHIISFAIIYGN